MLLMISCRNVLMRCKMIPIRGSITYRLGSEYPSISGTASSTDCRRIAEDQCLSNHGPGIILGRYSDRMPTYAISIDILSLNRTDCDF